MKLQLSATGVLAVVAVGVAGFVVWRVWNSSAVAAAGEILSTDLNPTNSQNIINRGVNAAVQAATGDDSQSLGGWIYDALHPHAFDNNPTPFPVKASSSSNGGTDDYWPTEPYTDPMSGVYGGW